MKKHWKLDRRLQEQMQQEIEVPPCVDEKLEEAYRMIGAGEKGTMKHVKRHRRLVGLAAAVGLFAAASMVVVAANHYFSVTLKEKENVKEYQFEVDKTQTAYEIKVQPTYIPEGYVLYGKEEDYNGDGGKWHNDQNDGKITIMSYNASEVDAMMSSDGQDSFLQIAKNAEIENKEIQGMDTDVVVQQGNYENTVMTNVFLFGKEEGYVVRVWHEGDLSKEELEKVAEGIKVEVTDTEVAYISDKAKKAEEEARKAEWLSEEQARDLGVRKEQVYQVGEEIRNTAPEMMIKEAREQGEDEFADMIEESLETQRDDILFTVLDAQVRDTLPTDEFPEEYFYRYEEELAPWLNEDGTLKPHNRVKFSWFGDGDEEGLTETVNSKFVVVKIRAKANKIGERMDETGLYIVPSLTTLTEKPDGNYALPQETYHATEKGYSLQNNSYDLSSFPIYFDKVYNTEGIERLKRFCYYPIKEGETLEYMVAYVVDEDMIPDMKLWFYEYERGTQNGERDMTSYVDISQ